jgi:2-oxoglutarate ferredoxin oxidoreductase subunit gamma
MNSHYEIRFSGSGGQGMMLIGDIFADAAGYHEDKELVLTKSYGPESRGGACRSELILDIKSINYPVLVKPDLVLAMTQMACDKYAGDLDAKGVLLVDCDLVQEVPEHVENVYRIPLTKIAEQATGKVTTANMVAMGAITVLGQAAGYDSVKNAIVGKFQSGPLLEMNLKAFAAGIEAAKKASAETAKDVL